MRIKEVYAICKKRDKRHIFVVSPQYDVVDNRTRQVVQHPEGCLPPKQMASNVLREIDFGN